MSTPLRVLNVEDSADDAELLTLQLGRLGFDVTARRVETADGFAAALDSGTWDIVISDHSLPTFSAPEALRMLESRGIDIPFIVMSGTMDATTAIELMRAGAHDFITKDQPARLDPVVHRELREAANRRARTRAESDLERLVGELQAANRSKDEFLAMLGHELRNPIAPIVTAVDLLKLRGGGKPSAELKIIERQVDHLRRLVDDLLDVAKIARGKVELKRQRVEVAAAVARAVEMASPILEERRHHFTLDVPAKGLLVDVDEARIAQVISNLLTNAARYTPPGGDISLTAARDGADVVLRVKDSGIGIEPDALPRIFDLFVQGTRAIDRSEGGLGIGLALVHNLVTLHGGTVSAHSEGRDRGTEVIVRLPATTPFATGDHPIEKPRAARGAPRAVLIVDDNEDAAAMLGELVGLAGHDVRVAFDGPGALAELERFNPDVAILDIGLPVMDGYELARQIRAHAGHAAMKLVALTGYGQASDRERTREAGFDMHLVKPIDAAALLGAIEGLFANG